MNLMTFIGPSMVFYKATIWRWRVILLSRSPPGFYTHPLCNDVPFLHVPFVYYITNISSLYRRLFHKPVWISMPKSTKFSNTWYCFHVPDLWKFWWNHNFVIMNNTKIPVKLVKYAKIPIELVKLQFCGYLISINLGLNKMITILQMTFPKFFYLYGVTGPQWVNPYFLKPLGPWSCTFTKKNCKNDWL